MSLPARAAVALTRWTERWIPSSFVIALLLTALLFVLAVTLTPTSPLDAVRAWGNGFWTLLGFAMQMTLILVSGFVVAVSPAVDRLLSAVARLPRGPRSCVAWMAFLSMILALLHWGLSIVGSAVLVKRFARRQPGVDYRLLVAAAYLGLGATWHAGLSASAPLLVATPGHFLEAQMGVVPLGETLFSPFNLTLAGAVLLIFTALPALLHPPRGKALVVDPALLAAAAEPAFATGEAAPAGTSFAERLERTPWLGRIVGLAGFLWLGLHFAARGAVTLDVVNFGYLFLGIFLHGSAHQLVRAVEHGVRLASGVILQFPFYAGMYGILQGSGLAEVIGRGFATVATRDTLPGVVLWYSGLVNYFVPSGGSKWAIEAPYLVAAAQALETPVRGTVLAYAWGDMLTDLIQPFWALPLLKAAGLEFRHILGYSLLLFALYGTLVSAVFWWYPP